MIILVCSRANEGYSSALSKSFKFKSVPVKSSLSKFRKKISYLFFQDLFYKLLSNFMPHRATFKGRRIYAIDGKWIYLPRTPELEKKGFRGRVLAEHRHTRHLRMHMTHAYDVLSGVSKSVRMGRHQDETTCAISMVKSFEKGSIVLYDRLYLCRPLIKAHLKKGNYFVMRMKSGGTLKELSSFLKSKKRKEEVSIEGVKMIACRVKTKSGESLYLTNLVNISGKKISLLYRERWDVEASFKELVESFALESWHSKDYNGIMQELYARLWIYNFTKIQIYLRSKKKRREIGKTYYRANTKLVGEFIVNHFLEFYQRKRWVVRAVKDLIDKSLEKRKRYTRSYPRELKHPASPYKYNNTVWVFNGKTS